MVCANISSSDSNIYSNIWILKIKPVLKNPFNVKGHFSVTLSIQSKERRKIVTALQKDEVL